MNTDFGNGKRNEFLKELDYFYFVKNHLGTFISEIDL